jgi:hypothetical protein
MNGDALRAVVIVGERLLFEEIFVRRQIIPLDRLPAVALGAGVAPPAA